MKKVNPFIAYFLIVLGIFISFYILTSNLSSLAIIFMPMNILIIALGIEILWNNNFTSNTLEGANLEKKGNKTFHITYKDYDINCILEDIPRKLLIPKNDTNGKKINYMDRNKLHYYLLNNYDLLSLPDEVIPVQISEAKNNFKNLILCNEEQKNQFLKKQEFSGPYKYSLYIIIIAIIFLPLSLSNTSFINKNNKIFIFLGILIFTIIISLLLRFKNYKKAKERDYYYQDVKVFDRKRISDNENNIYYYIRICDDKNHVLMKWFPTNKLFYNNGQSGTLYINDEEAFFIEKEQ